MPQLPATTPASDLVIARLRWYVPAPRYPLLRKSSSNQPSNVRHYTRAAARLTCSLCLTCLPQPNISTTRPRHIPNLLFFFLLFPTCSAAPSHELPRALLRLFPVLLRQLLLYPELLLAQTRSRWVFTTSAGKNGLYRMKIE